MARAVTVLVVLGLASPTAAQEGGELNRYRAGLSVGLGGTLADSQVTEQLQVASWELDVAYDVALSGQWWAERWLALGGELWVHHLDVTGRGRSSIITYAALFTGTVAARGGPELGNGEAALELGAGPALVSWELDDETASTGVLAVRLALRLGMETSGGFIWQLRPWLGTTVGWIGPSSLSTAGVSGGVGATLGWGWS